MKSVLEWKKLTMNFTKNCVDFAKNCSIHGIRNLVGASTSILERTFWASIIVSSLTFSAYLTTLFWSRCTSNPTRTLIESIAAPTTTVPFPAITICNLNKVLESKLERLLQKLEASDDEKNAIRSVISDGIVTEIPQKSSRLRYNATELALATNALANNGYDSMKKIVKVVSQSCDALIHRCFWNREQVLCKDIFEEIYTTRGRCCSFNYKKRDFSKPPIYNPYHGVSSGLRVILVPAFNTRNFAGVTVTVHHPRDFPRADYNLGKIAKMGHVQYIQVQGLKRICSDDVKVRFWADEDLQLIYRHCVLPHEKKLNFFKDYSYSNCLSSCEASMFLRRCHCLPYFHDFTSEMVDCNFQHLPCLDSFEEENTESCNCPPQCEDDSYKILSTSARVLNNSVFGFIGRLQNVNNTENSIFLNVFFSSNQQIVWLRETETSTIYLISSFGGIYSLFLGCSIITLIEIMYYFIGRNFIQQVRPRKGIKEKGEKVDKIFTVKREKIAGEVEWNHHYSYPVVPFIN